MRPCAERIDFVDGPLAGQSMTVETAARSIVPNRCQPIVTYERGQRSKVEGPKEPSAVSHQPSAICKEGTKGMVSGRARPTSLTADS